MTHIIAYAGEEIRDPSGNLYATVVRNISKYDGRPNRVENFKFEASAPQNGERMPAFMHSWLKERKDRFEPEPQFQRRKVV